MARRGRAQWEPCHPGEFSRLAKKLRHRRQRRLFLGAAGALAVTAAAGGVLALWFGRGAAHRPGPGKPGEFFYAGISCTDVKAQADAYGKGEVTPTARDQIRKHLEQCVSCTNFYKAKGFAANTPHGRSTDHSARV